MNAAADYSRPIGERLRDAGCRAIEDELRWYCTDGWCIGAPPSDYPRMAAACQASKGQSAPQELEKWTTTVVPTGARGGSRAVDLGLRLLALESRSATVRRCMSAISFAHQDALWVVYGFRAPDRPSQGEASILRAFGDMTELALDTATARRAYAESHTTNVMETWLGKLCDRVHLTQGDRQAVDRYHLRAITLEAEQTRGSALSAYRAAQDAWRELQRVRRTQRDGARKALLAAGYVEPTWGDEE